LRFASMFLRGIQTNVLCAAYASFVLQSHGRDERRMWPISMFLIVEILVVFIVACVDDSDLSCGHPFWLLMSVSQLVVTLVFVTFGTLAFREVSKLEASLTASSSEVDGTQRVNIHTTNLKKREIWVLMTVFLLASMSDVVGDCWRFIVESGGINCRYHDTNGEEFVRTVLDILAFTAPIFAILFVFYYQDVNARYSVHPSEEVDFDANGVELQEVTDPNNPLELEGISGETFEYYLNKRSDS
jgi:hypothetical protein